jgi:hypothetical protein
MMVKSGATGAKSPNYEYRWNIRIRGYYTMYIQAETQHQAMLFIECLLPEYGRSAILEQRTAGRWIKASVQPQSGSWAPIGQQPKLPKKKAATAVKTGRKKIRRAVI